MARRRVMDWKKFFEWARGKGWPKTLTMLGILGTVDDFGLASWSPATVAMALMECELNKQEITVSQVARIMRSFTLGRDPELVTWLANGRRYLALRKHQDYQRVRLPGNADCPYPPQEVLVKLSPVSRLHITKHLQKFTGNPAPEVEVEEEVEVEDEKNPAVSGKTSPIPEFLDGYGRLYQKHHGAKPTITRGKDARIAQTMISEAGSVETALGIIEVGLMSTDPFLRDGGYSLGVLKTKWAGLKLAHEKGQAHGSAGQEIKRQDAGPRDQDWGAR